jgi:septal ring-binding cell division protein DamX
MYSTQAMPVDDVARVASQAAKPTLDLLGGDEVLDLPSFGLITTAPSKGDVLDVDLGSAPTPPPIIAPPAAPPAAPTGGATLVMSSPARPAPPPLAAPPPPVVEAPPEAPRFDIPRPEPLRTVPLPIAPSPSEPERPESKLDYRAAARPRPPAVEPPAPPPAPAIEPQPSEDFFQPLLAPSSDRVSPAELSGEPEAWVAPTVAPSAGRRKSKTRLPLVAVLVVAILGGGGYALWTYAVRDLVSPQRESAGPVSTPPTEAGPDKPKTDQPPTIETPKMAPTKSALPPVADATPTIPPGPGNFTLQVQSNPDEAASNALAERLKSNGVDAYVVRADLGAKGIWFRVRVGRYETSEEARAKGSSMRASGKIPSFIVVAWE